MPEAVVAGLADVAGDAEVPGHGLHMAGDAVGVVDRNGEPVQFDEGLVVGDGIDPAFAVLPVADRQRHFVSLLLSRAIDGREKRLKTGAVAHLPPRNWTMPFLGLASVFRENAGYAAKRGG